MGVKSIGGGGGGGGSTGQQDSSFEDIGMTDVCEMSHSSCVSFILRTTFLEPFTLKKS